MHKSKAKQRLNPVSQEMEAENISCLLVGTRAGNWASLVLHFTMKCLTPVIMQFSLCACSIDLPLQFSPCLFNRTFIVSTDIFPPSEWGTTSLHSVTFFSWSHILPFVRIQHPVVNLLQAHSFQLSWLPLIYKQFWGQSTYSSLWRPGISSVVAIPATVHFSPVFFFFFFTFSEWKPLLMFAVAAV